MPRIRPLLGLEKGYLENEPHAGVENVQLEFAALAAAAGLARVADHPA